MKKRTGVVVDYFGVFANLEKALNFDENIREESLIDWDALRATVPGEVARCMELFEGITIADTRECLLAALRRLRDPDAAKNFEHNFKSLERLWEAVAPDPCLYPHRYQYNWLCGIYVAHRRRQRGSKDTYGELSAKTRQLIEENTTFVDIAEVAAGLQDRQGLRHQARRTANAGRQGGGAGGHPDRRAVGGRSELHLPSARRALAASQGAQGRGRRSYGEAPAGAGGDCGGSRLDEAGAGTPQSVAAGRVRTIHDPASARAIGRRELSCRLRAADGWASANEPTANAWMEQLDWRTNARRAVACWRNRGTRIYATLGFDPDADDPPFLKPAVSELAKSDGAG